MNLTPTCPNCNNDMYLERSLSNTYNQSTKQEYEAEYYGCKACDVWITLESPVEEE